MKVIILGSTGLVGTETVKLFQDADDIEQLILPVRNLNFNFKNKNRLTIFPLEIENLQKELCKYHAETAICALGTTIKKAASKEKFREIDHDLVIKSAWAAKNSGVKHFIFISSIGADSRSSNFYLKTKGETEKDLDEIGFESLSILRPSLLVGKRNEYRIGEELGKIISNAFKFIIPKKYKLIYVKTVAIALLYLTLSPAKGVRYYSNEELFDISLKIEKLIHSLNLSQDNNNNF